MESGKYHDPIQTLRLSLFCLIDIDNPYEFLLKDEEIPFNIKCPKCKHIPHTIFQSENGVLLCFDCVCKSDDKERTYFDRRLNNMIFSTVTKCHLHEKGCDWTGKIEMYPQHILVNCDFAKIRCYRCNASICVKDMNVHEETYECINHDTIRVKCPFDCGYVDKCPKSKKEKPSQENDNGDSTESDSRKCLEYLLMFHRNCHDVFETKINGRAHHDGNEIVVLQNMIPVKLLIILDHSSESLNVHVQLCQKVEIMSILKILKETIVTLTFLNKNKDCPDRETLNYKVILPYNPTLRENCIFSKLNVMKIKNMLFHSENKTCYYDAT